MGGRERPQERDRSRRVRVDEDAGLVERELVGARDREPALVLGAIALVHDPHDRDRADREQRDEPDRGRHDRGEVLLDEAAGLLLPRVVVRRDELPGEEPLEIRGERARVLVAIARLLRERLVDDRRQLRGDALDDLADRRRWAGHGQPHHLVGGPRVVRRPPRQHVVERRAERVDIAAFVDRGAAQLLGCHEPRGAEHDADPRVDGVVEPRRFGRRAPADDVVGLADHLREAPVDHHRLAELADEDVRRLDVAMHDAALVSVGDGLGGVHEVLDEAEAILDVARRRDERLERAPRDLAHHVVGHAIRRRPGVVDRHDRRVLEAGGDLGLALEARERVGVERQRLLHRDHAAEHGVERLDHAPHAAARDLALQRVPRRRRRRDDVGELVAGQRRHRRWARQVRVDRAEEGRQRRDRRLAVGHRGWVADEHTPDLGRRHHGPGRLWIARHRWRAYATGGDDGDAGDATRGVSRSRLTARASAHTNRSPSPIRPTMIGMTYQ
ncbi:MAG: hypothetical protein NT062_12915 [Proteobacteria bacterium]|nr:hypothetical protein [Pseudomonadota bacterium]